jgi:hypothetical protein
MENKSVGYAVISVAIVGFLIYVIFIFYELKLNADKKVINVAMNGSDIQFIFINRENFVYGYEIRSLRERNQGGLEFKKLLDVTVGKKTNEINIYDYKTYNLEENEPYYLSIERQGIRNEPGVVLQTVNFCIKQSGKIYSESNSDIFIRNCLN